MVEIRPILRWSQLFDFFSLARRVYELDPGQWVPPLTAYTFLSMGRLREPGKVFLMAYRDGRPVARCGFKIHHEALHFGYFEALPDTHEEVRALFAEGQKLAPQLPLRGPHQFRLEDPYTGLLVDGFQHSPHLFMTYNPPYYWPLLEAAGFEKDMDLLTYEVRPERLRTEAMKSRAERGRARGMRAFAMGSGDLSRKVKNIAAVFNDALSQNWGFEPIEGQQLQELELLARFVLDPEMVFFAEWNGEIVGCCILLPNLNPMLSASRGRFNWTLLKKYWSRRRWVESWRGYAIGVLQKYQQDEVAAVLLDEVLQKSRQIRWQHCEVSWVLESNTRMKAMVWALGGVHNKTYRVLQRLP